RIQNANEAYFGLFKHFKSRILTRETKCNLYKTLLKHVLLYEGETWTLTRPQMQRLRCFETRILRKIGYMGQSVKKEYGGSSITSNCINYTNLLMYCSNINKNIKRELWRVNVRARGKLGDRDCDGLMEHWRI
ncbi:hypothetical protein C0J52_06607, partial [Blattella germanica]